MAKRGRGRPRKTVCGDGADFFKVLMRQTCFQQLMIPPDFVTDFKRTMTEKVILKDLGGKKWHIDVKETTDGVFLMKGWESFVKYHGLKVGEFLVFEYERCYTFVVKIYGTSGCKKEASENIATDVKIKEEKVEEIEEDQASAKRPRTDKEDYLSTASERSEHSERFGEENVLQELNVLTKVPEESEDAEGVLSECPYFVSPPVQRKNKLRIPDEVINKHNIRLKADMILCNADGKKWHVTTFSQYTSKFFGSGWLKFQVDNNMRLGDCCKFTFERSGRTVHVQILPSDPHLSCKMRRPPRKIASNNFVDRFNLLRTDFHDRVPEVVKSSVEEVPYSCNLPEFFKLYIPALCSQKARIPPAFIKKFGGKIPKICTLKSPTGSSNWQVEVNKINDHWFLQKGWPEFVQDNSLEDRDFLTFSYAGNGTFHVKVFTRNCCRKIAENVDDKPTENLQQNKACPPENPMNNRETRRSLVPKSSTEEASVVENPSFLLSVTRTQLNLLFLTVPMRFWIMHMRRDARKSSRMVTLRTKNKKWMVSVRIRSERISLVGGDMLKFFTDNSLKKGTPCTFQLIDANDLAFEVTVHR